MYITKVIKVTFNILEEINEKSILLFPLIIALIIGENILYEIIVPKRIKNGTTIDIKTKYFLILLYKLFLIPLSIVVKIRNDFSNLIFSVLPYSNFHENFF